MNSTFIAFSTVTGSALALAETAEKARLDAVKNHGLQNDDFIEVIEHSASQGLMSLVARRVDKKKDIRAGFFCMKNRFVVCSICTFFLP